MEPLALAKEFTQDLHKLGMYEQFNALPSAHQREYFKWVSEAKQPATRLARLLKMQEMLAKKAKPNLLQ